MMRLFCIAVLFVACVSQVVCRGAEQTYDCSTPEKVFASFQKALKSRDAEGLWEIYFQAARTTKRKEKAIKEYQTMKWDDGVFAFVQNASLNRITSSQNQKLRVLWVSSAKKIGYLWAGKAGKRWYICFPQDVDFVFPAYDFSKPKKAFLSFTQAIEIKDYGGIFENIDSRLRKGIQLDDYMKAVKEDKGEFADLRDYDDKHLKEEHLKSGKGKDKRKKCKVWKLDDDGKREDFELFVKAGKKWQWIPKPEYTLFPKKPKKESNGAKKENEKNNNLKNNADKKQ